MSSSPCVNNLAQEIKRLTAAHGIRMNTDFGQHFLTDATVLRDLLEAGKVTREDTVLEIGAGMGILTKELIGRAGKVIAVEVDKRWLPLLEEYVGMDTAEARRLTVIKANALKIPFPEEPYKIVANIPYHITSRLFRQAFLHAPLPPISMTLLVQKEVADKIRGKDGRTMLTILIELFGKPRMVRTVPPGAFAPPPRVDSAIIHVDCFPSPLLDKPGLDAVFRLTSLAFGKKRKMLRRSIGKIHGGMELLERAGIDPERRPETLSIEEWVVVAKASLKD